jgi:hypothetical protein
VVRRGACRRRAVDACGLTAMKDAVDLWRPLRTPIFRHPLVCRRPARSCRAFGGVADGADRRPAAVGRADQTASTLPRIRRTLRGHRSILAVSKTGTFRPTRWRARSARASRPQRTIDQRGGRRLMRLTSGAPISCRHGRRRKEPLPLDAAFRGRIRAAPRRFSELAGTISGTILGTVGSSVT